MLGTYWLTTSQALSETSECLSSQLSSPLEESSSSMSNGKSESDNAAEVTAAAAFN